MTIAIEVKEIEKTFKGGIRALCGVSFAVAEGSIFGLLGPNGAGKTTAIRVLTTIIRPDAGEAWILGHNVAQEPNRVRPLFGLAGQFAAVDENLTGRENLKLVGKLNHMAKTKVGERSEQLLGQFDLSDAADRTVKTYSGGMRRRLDLAAALVAEPPILILDEPTTGLDPQSRLGLWEVIEKLVRDGTTVLLTTQYLEEADRLAREVAVIDHGKVISQGTPSELKANLGATVLEVGFIDDEIAKKGAAALANVATHAPHILGTMIELNVDAGPRVAMEALRLLDQHQIEPVSFTLREPSLDDVFLSLTGTTTKDAEEDEATAPTTGRAARRSR